MRILVLLLALSVSQASMAPGTAAYVAARIQGGESRLQSPAFSSVRARMQGRLNAIRRMAPAQGTTAINAWHAELDRIEAGGPVVTGRVVGYHPTSARIDEAGLRRTRVRPERAERVMHRPVWGYQGNDGVTFVPVEPSAPRRTQRVQPRPVREQPRPRPVAPPSTRLVSAATPPEPRPQRRTTFIDDIGAGLDRFGQDLGRLGDRAAQVVRRFVRLPVNAVKAFVEDIEGLIMGDRDEDRRWATPRLAAGLYKIAEDLRARGAPVLRFGDISREGGGKISGHRSHRRGVDADVRLYVTSAGPFDHRLNTEIIKSAMRHLEVHQFYLNQVRISELCGYWRASGDALHGELCRYNGKGAKLRQWRGHTQHVHIRIRG